MRNITYRILYDFSYRFLNKFYSNEDTISILNYLLINKFNLDYRLLKFKDYSIKDIHSYLNDILRISLYEPVQSVISKTIFYGYEIQIESNVFIPRVETEVVVDIALKYIRSMRAINIYDICTGSGAIICTIYKETNGLCNYYASEINNKIKDVFFKNTSSMKINYYNGDFRYAFLYMKDRFDLIVSNPPYIPVRRYKYLPNTVKHYDYSSSIISSNDGLDDIISLLHLSSSLLRPGGVIVIEYDDTHMRCMSIILLSFIRLRVLEYIFDLNMRPRGIVIQRRYDS